MMFILPWNRKRIAAVTAALHPNGVKFCKDCKHSKLNPFVGIFSFMCFRGYWYYAKCWHPGLVKINAGETPQYYVGGRRKIKIEPYYCSVMRNSSSCNSTGYKWEPCE